MAPSSSTLAAASSVAPGPPPSPSSSSSASSSPALGPPHSTGGHPPVSASTPTRASLEEDGDPAAALDEIEREPLDDAESLAARSSSGSECSSPCSTSMPLRLRFTTTSKAPPLSPAASSSRGSSSSAGCDRELFAKLEEVTSELDRLSRLSTALPENRELEVVQAQLRRAQRSSSVMVQTQRELLDKIDRHERSSFRRYFQFNREQKVESLKDKLWARMSESASVERELQQLERKSDSMLVARRTVLDVGGGGGGGGGGGASSTSSSSSSSLSSSSLEAAQLAWRMDELERERQQLVGCLLQTIPAPETRQLSTRIAMYVSEIRASESIQKQVERCAALYREALRQLQAALAVLLSSAYTGTLKEFVTGPYILAVEAGHQVEAAGHVLQPEARRRYRSYAPDLLHVRPPKFPQAVVDFAKRARVNYDRKSSLSAEGARKLHAAESVVVLLHRIVIQKLELLDQWRAEVEQDVARAAEAHDRAEARLHQQIAVLARSASA